MRAIIGRIRKWVVGSFEWRKAPKGPASRDDLDALPWRGWDIEGRVLDPRRF